MPAMPRRHRPTFHHPRAFLDRRVFLIMTLPRTPGSTLKVFCWRLLPVGAGINLEYYFSTVNNDRFAVAPKYGTTSRTLRRHGRSLQRPSTGLPKQMIEIHEAMRLQIVAEHRTEVLAAIYERQPALQELIGNGWCCCPRSIRIAGISARSAEAANRGTKSLSPAGRRTSTDWYVGHTEALPPALIQQTPAGVSYA